MKKLIELRTKLILLAVAIGLIASALEVHAWAGWPFHFPEMEGGVEVTMENLRHQDEKAAKRVEEELQLQREEEDRIKNSMRDLMNELEWQKQREDWKRCQETGVI